MLWQFYSRRLPPILSNRASYNILRLPTSDQHGLLRWPTELSHPPHPTSSPIPDAITLRLEINNPCMARNRAGNMESIGIRRMEAEQVNWDLPVSIISLTNRPRYTSPPRNRKFPSSSTCAPLKLELDQQFSLDPSVKADGILRAWRW